MLRIVSVIILTEPLEITKIIAKYVITKYIITKMSTFSCLIH